MARPIIDLTGKRFGRLIARERVENLPGSNQPRWRCDCDCGGVNTVYGMALRDGSVRSCRCLARDTTRSRATVHGFTAGKRAPEYKALEGARRRCTKSYVPEYRNYGGRGIEYRMPENLGTATADLIAAIGRRPDGLQLDRIDNDGHYEIGNLRWATRTEQLANRRNTKAV